MKETKVVPKDFSAAVKDIKLVILQARARAARVSDVARYSMLRGNEQLFASRYRLCLPSEAELKAEIEAQKQRFVEQYAR